MPASTGLVDGPADVFDADDFEEKIEMAGAIRTNRSRRSRCSVWMSPFVQPHDDAARARRALLERHDPADDQLGRLATAVERSLDEADQVVLDQLAHLGELLGPEHGRGRAAQVLEGQLGHPRQAGPALLDVADLDVGDHPAQDDLGLFGEAGQVGDAMGRQGLEQIRVARQGMARHVEAERLLLAGQHLGIGQLGDVGQVARRRPSWPLPLPWPLEPAAIVVSRSSKSPRWPRRRSSCLAWPA